MPLFPLKAVFQGLVVRSSLWFPLSGVTVALGVDELHSLWMSFSRSVFSDLCWNSYSTGEAVWEVFKDIKELLQ